MRKPKRSWRRTPSERLRAVSRAAFRPTKRKRFNNRQDRARQTVRGSGYAASDNLPRAGAVLDPHGPLALLD